MRKILGLLLFGLLLSGCYTNSLTMVGPATGVASGKFSETVASTTVNHVVKKRTGKTPLEHVLSEKQIKTDWWSHISQFKICNKDDSQMHRINSICSPNCSD